MNQEIIRLFASCAILLAMGTSAQARNEMVTKGITQVPDTIPFGYFEDERAARDSSQFTHKNEAKDKGARSAMEYVMDKRYLNQGETFKDKWYDHLFFDIGGGFEQLNAPISSYKFKPLTKAKVAVGKQFDKLNSVRVGFNGGWGYLNGTNDLFKTFGATADYMYSLSSYFYGYNPSRLFNVSAIAGLGFRSSKLGSDRSGSAFDVHVGAQGKFYTGPHGYIAVEPYVGIGSDAMDLSEKRNWRKNDMFWGVNFSYIYYIKNNLSRESRFREIRALEKKAQMANDSTPMRWAQPWFIEVSNGLVMSKSPRVGLMDSKGLETTISAGKWFSPVIGLRLTASVRETTWMKDSLRSTVAYKPEYYTNRKNIYFGGRLEAMFNPFGFKKDFDWSDKFGMYIVGGGELGWIIKNNEQRLSCHAESYTAGVNLWARLGQGVSVFVEPRYAFTQYHIPYTNYKANKVFSDDYFTVNVGVRVQNHGVKGYRPAASADNMNGRLSVGLGGGTNFFLTKQNNNDKAKINFNGRAFVDYKIKGISSVEAAFEYVSISNSLRGYYWDCNNEYPDNDYLRVKKSGLMDYKYNYGFVSLNYVANLSQLLYGESKEGRKFEFDVFVGPAYALAMNNTVTLTKAERLQQNHFIEPLSEGNSKSFVTVNAGVRLRANITKNIGVWLTPTFYWMGTNELEGIDFMKVKYVETVNLGVQYNF